MKNKKTLILISSLMILLYHLWIPITSSKIEIFLRYIMFIGVDIFFLVSGYSLAKKEYKYKDFIKNRFINIYLKFIVFVLIISIYKSWDILKIIKTIFGIEFFIKGGGSFLWFIPAIMILYLIMPIYKKLDNKYKYTKYITILVWIILTITLSLYTNYNSIFILTNRIPIYLLGYYIGKYNLLDKINNKIYYILSIILIIIGFIISYIFFYKHINILFIKESYYLVCIPLIIGITLLLNKINSNKIIDKLSNISLDLYGIQMIIGYDICNILIKNINSKIIINILTIVILIIISLIFNYIYKYLLKITKLNK